MAGTETAKDNVTPCQHCGETEYLDIPEFDDGVVLRVKRICRGCERYIKFVPKREAGYDPRSVTSRRGFNPKKRRRVLERDNYRCVLCGADSSSSTMHVSHIVSVKDGDRYGIDQETINSEDNLIALCEECNLGYGAESLAMSQAFRIYHVRRLRGW